MPQRFHRLILLIFLFLCAFPVQAQRIASLNYCYDQLLRGLTTESLKHTEEIYLLEQHGGRLERIIQWQPDVVLANAFNSVYLLDRLRDQGMNVQVLTEPQSRQQVEQFAAEFYSVVGAEPEEIRFNPGQSDAGQKSALLFQPNLYSWGRQSLFNDFLEDAGLVNLAAEQGEGLVRTSLEDIIKQKPDLIILDSYTDSFALAGVAQTHRALSQLDAELIIMPADLSGCLGQRYTEALNWLMEHVP